MVYEGRMKNPFKNEEELKARMRTAWKECVTNTTEIRKAIKQFVPRLRTVNEKRGYSIKTVFG